MQLDKTRIVIRERSATELLDLTLRVLGLYFVPIVATSGILVVPLAILNELLLRHFIVDELSEFTIPHYTAAMAQLVYIEAPFATSLTTLFLGRMMFMQSSGMRPMLSELWSVMPRLVWTQLILRGVFAAVFVAIIAQNDPDGIYVLWFVLLGVGALRMARPFINEIVLLEKNPLWSSAKHTITVGRRSSRLHGPSSGDLFARSLLVALVLATAVVSIALTFWFVQGLLTNLWMWGHVMVRIFIPLSMWIVATYSTVYRFLNYLDLRIRREGWEVELQVRAAASELQGMQI